MEFTVPDTLVLKIIEYDEFKTDTKLYILYDKSINRYIIRGSRQDTSRVKTCTYSFECEFAKDLVDFIDFLIDHSNTVSYILYNYDNLPALSNDITYEFLHDHGDARNEIAGYDNQKLNKKVLVKNLRMLRNVFNYNN